MSTFWIYRAMRTLDGIVEAFLFFCFVSFLAWAASTLYGIIRRRGAKIPGRVLRGPYLPLPGLSGALIFILDRNLTGRLPEWALICSCAAVPILADVGARVALRRTSWEPRDLSAEPLNAGGLVSLGSVLAWASFALIVLFVLESLFLEIAIGMPNRLSYFLAGFFLALMALDAVYGFLLAGSGDADRH